MNSLISITDLTKENILKICNRAQEIKIKGFSNSLQNKIVAILFFEPSTRTKMSFESSIYRLGANVLNFETENSSLKKGETLEDTIRMASSYADIIIIRHPEEHAALRAKQVSTCPIINAGDGHNEHPTQTLLDLFTILEDNGSIDNFTITLAGDLKYSRTIHSLIYGLTLFDNINIKLSTTNSLTLSKKFKDLIQDKIIMECNSLKESLDVDYFYMTRVQKERLSQTEQNISYEENWIITKNICEQYANNNTKIMHPLPRINEIHTDLDNTKYQLYFTQAENGIYIRAAILEYIFGKL